MERLPLIQTDQGFHVEGFPDAVKVIALGGPKARRLADLALHRKDLEFAADCLVALDGPPEGNEVIALALFRAALVHLMKCFGDSGARFQLSAAKVYHDEPPEALVVFQYFSDLRNKHIVHDENSYAQGVPGAILNNGRKPHKIEKIVCVTAISDARSPESIRNLRQLIDKALAWVVAQFDGVCVELTKDLETEPYQALLARKSVAFTAPNVEDVGKRRPPGD